MNRRQFLVSTALGGVGTLILTDGRSARGYRANEKLGIALIGVGGRGSWFAQTIPSLGENVVAMCDVNERRAAGSFKRLPNVKKYHDFRKMLREMEKQIDAVIVATPDHTHAVASMMAMTMGKHVYCEKPLTHDVYESRLLRETAAKRNVATQMGNQGTASEAFRRCVELVQGGVLGEIREVHAWNTGGGPGHRKRPTGTHTVPEYLQWDLWLGPAPYRPFHPDWLAWHGWREFGTGVLGNWACHTMNLAFKALKMDSLWYAGPSAGSKALIRLQADVSEIDRNSFPRLEVVRYDVPARGELPPVKLNWYNGGGNLLEEKGIRGQIRELLGRPLDWSSEDDPIWKDWAGILLVGKNGKLYSNAHNTEFTLLPEDKFKGLEGPPRSLPRSRGHEREWLDACKGGPPAMSNFNYAGPLTEFVLLANVATQFDHEIEFDPIAMKIVNSEEADKALRREYREGWSL
jgi:hypothetical protein